MILGTVSWRVGWVLVGVIGCWLTSHRLSINAESMRRGILVVPGLGRSDRLQVVYDNIVNLLGPTRASTPAVQWDCVIYVYTSRTESEFWTSPENAKKWSYLSSRCDIVENIGKKVTENMYSLQPALIRAAYQYVFILLDDIRAPTSTSGSLLQQMIDALTCNRLSVLSPMVTAPLSRCLH